MAAQQSAAGSNVPSRKVVAASTSGAVTALVVWLLSTYVFHGALPAAVNAAVQSLLPGITAGITGWWVRNVEHTKGSSS